MKSLVSLQQDHTRLLAAAGELVYRGLKSNEQKAEHRRLIAEADALSEQINMLQNIETRLQANRSHQEKPTQVSPEVQAAVITPEQRRARTNYVWRSWLKSGFSEQIAEHRDLLSSSDGTGGALVPLDFQTEFVSQALKFYAPFVNYARVRWTDAAQPLKVSRVDDRESGLYLITEGGSVPEVDPTDFSSTTLTYDQFSTGEIIFSNNLLTDSAFDLVKFLGDLSSTRFGRGLSRVLTLGQDFTSSPQSTPNNAGIISLASTATQTASLAAGIGWDDISNTFDALDVSFLPKSVWMMSSATRKYLAQLEDSTSRPYFVPSPTVDGFDMLLGRPVVINQDMGAVGTANAVPIIFADLYNGLEVAIRRLRLITLRERYASTNESAIITYTGVASTALAPGAIQALKLAAS